MTSWLKSTCPTFADVEVWLQAYSCNIFGLDCGWDTLEHRESRVREGGGGGRRTTARVWCTLTGGPMVAWRNMVDVDVVDMWYNLFRATQVVDRPCCPS